MSSGGSKLAVTAAISANLIVMVAKFVGWTLTGSGALLAESLHSFADVGNQTLLAVGMKRGAAPADSDHPDGYGREAFVWALISAVGIFFLGAGASLMHAIQALLGSHHEEAPGTIALYILLGSLIIEGISFGIAIKVAMDNAKARRLSLKEHLKSSEDPFEMAVLLEDGAAVLGIVLAFAAIYLTRITGNPMWDAVGTLMIGLLLGFVALVLINLNRNLIIGQRAGNKDKEAIARVFEESEVVEKVTHQSEVITGPDSLTIRAELDFDGQALADHWLATHEVPAKFSEPESRAFLGQFAESITEQIGDEIDALEARLRKEIPKATQIHLEVD